MLRLKSMQELNERLRTVNLVSEEGGGSMTRQATEMQLLRHRVMNMEENPSINGGDTNIEFIESNIKSSL